VSSSILIRLGGLAAMMGGIVYAGVGLVEERLAEYLYYAGNIGYGFIAVLIAARGYGGHSDPPRFAQGTLRSGGSGSFPNGLLRPSARHGRIDGRGYVYLPGPGLPIQLGPHRVARGDRWHSAFGRPNYSHWSAASVVWGSAHSRESRRCVRDDDSFGGAGRGVPARGSVPGTGWRALGAGRLRPLSSRGTSSPASLTGAVRGRKAGNHDTY
jgi:hypothetical protein